MLRETEGVESGVAKGVRTAIKSSSDSALVVVALAFVDVDVGESRLGEGESAARERDSIEGGDSRPRGKAAPSDSAACCAARFNAECNKSGGAIRPIPAMSQWRRKRRESIFNLIASLCSRRMSRSE